MKFELNAFNRNITDEELLLDLALVDAQLKSLGGSLTFRSYQKLGKYSAHTINTRFGSWNEGVRKSGLAAGQEKNISHEALFDNLRNVWIAKGNQPVFRDMSLIPSLYSASVYSDRFGSWRMALKEFVRSIDQDMIEIKTHGVKAKNRQVNKQNSKKTKRDPSLALRFLVLKRDNFCCATCGRSPATLAGLTLEIDHVVPWSKGGETIVENLQTLCFECNRGKSAYC